MARWFRTSDAWIFGALVLVAGVVRGPALAESLRSRLTDSQGSVAAESQGGIASPAAPASEEPSSVEPARPVSPRIAPSPPSGLPAFRSPAGSSSCGQRPW